MERLTEKQSSGYDLKAMNGEYCNRYCEQQRVETCNECVIYQAIQKLAEYEDAEEQGLLLRLPVPIGTTVYPLANGTEEYIKTTITRYEIFEDSIWFTFANGLGGNIEDFGKYVFLTQEEAEQKLKEMKNKESENNDQTDQN